MKNEVTEKLEVFLQNLRCEDAKRETERLAGLEEQYTQVMDGLEQRSRAILEHYIEQILSKAFAEQQEAYLQGMIDAFQIFCGLGILSTNENVEKIIARLKNGEPE